MTDAGTSETAGGDRYLSRTGALWMTAVFCIAGLVSYTDRLILSVLVDPLRADLGIGDAQVSLLQGAAFAVVYVLAGLPLGRLADRGRRRQILILGATIWCLGTVFCGLAPGFWSLFAGRLVIGVGEATLGPAAISMLADAVRPERRGAAVGVFLMGTVLGGPFAISIGGLLLASAQAGTFADWPLLSTLSSWRIVLVLVGAGGLIVPLLFLTLTEPRRQQVKAVAAPFSELMLAFRRRWRVLVPLYLAMALLSVGDYAVLSWVPTALSRGFGWPPDQIGRDFGLITAIAGIGAALAGGLLSDAASRRAGARGRLWIAVVAAAAAAAAVLLIGAASPTLVLAGLGCWTFASFFAAIGGIAALQEVAPTEHRAVAISLVAFCNTLLGLGCGPTLVAFVTDAVFQHPDQVGPAIALSVAPAAAVATLLFVAAVRALSRQAQDEDPAPSAPVTGR